MPIHYEHAKGMVALVWVGGHLKPGFSGEPLESMKTLVIIGTTKWQNSIYLGHVNTLVYASKPQP